METKEKLLITATGLVGVLIGAGLGAGILNIDSPTERARFIEKRDIPVIEKRNIPRIIKVYNKSGIELKDQILIENPDNAGDYIPLRDYLERFDNKYERSFRKARIKLAVSRGE